MLNPKQLAAESIRATELLQGKTVARVVRHQAEVFVEFKDGERLFVNRTNDGVELSITGDASSEAVLTSREAYLAMFAFLEAHYQRTKSDDIGALLGDLTLLPGGTSADPAAIVDWQHALSRARGEVVDAGFDLGGPTK
ncbi:hypothetical protein [Caenimonas aquaedulcis]|nr:hypothetical protein [Caenimonas aquaedulcis]